MPLLPDDLYWRTKLFEHCDPITMSPEKFGQMWPLVNSVYSKTQGELLQNNGTARVQKYGCWLRKSTKSGTARPNTDDKTVKRRHSSIRDISVPCSNVDLPFGGRRSDSHDRMPWRKHIQPRYWRKFSCQKAGHATQSSEDRSSEKLFGIPHIPRLSGSRHIGRFNMNTKIKKCSTGNWRAPLGFQLEVGDRIWVVC